MLLNIGFTIFLLSIATQEVDFSLKDAETSFDRRKGVNKTSLTLNCEPCSRARFRFFTASAYAEAFFSAKDLLAKGKFSMPDEPEET